MGNSHSIPSKSWREQRDEELLLFHFWKRRKGTTTLKQRMADFSNAEYGTAPRKDIEDLTWWMNTDRLTVRNNNAFCKVNSKLCCLLLERHLRVRSVKEVYDTAAEHRELESFMLTGRSRKREENNWDAASSLIGQTSRFITGLSFLFKWPKKPFYCVGTAHVPKW